MQGITTTVPDPTVEIDWFSLGLGVARDGDSEEQAKFFRGFACAISTETWGPEQLAYIGRTIRELGCDVVIRDVLKDLVYHLEAEES